MSGYGFSPDAPDAPLVTVSLLFQPIRFVYQPLLILLGWIFQLLSSLWSEDMMKTTAVKSAARRAAEASATLLSQQMGYEEWSMTNDELI